MAVALEAARAAAAAAAAAAEVPVAAPGAEEEAAAAAVAAVAAVAAAVAPEAARGSAVAEATPAPVPAADCAHSPSQLGYCLCTCSYRCPARHQPQSAWRRGPVLSVGRAYWSPDQSLWLTEKHGQQGQEAHPRRRSTYK